jgi:tetratricopeptide (TPR) repeat protein
MNNLGFAREKEGEYQDAMKYYNAAAASGSNEPIVVTLNKDWRGKPIGEIAGENARKLQRLMQRSEDTQSQIARLNLRGVSALNRNERRKAREMFEQAYKLDETNAFTLNNMGYVAELDGDRETADYYYAKAKEANRADVRVAVATRRDAEGLRLGQVADTNGQIVNEAFREEVEAKRRAGGPIVLRRRDNTPVIDPATPQSPPNDQQQPTPAPAQQQPPEQQQSAPEQQPSAPIQQPQQ